MDLRELLYDNRDKIGIKNNVSYGDLVKLEDLIKEWNGSLDVKEDDIGKLVEISIKMRTLLEECRMNKLPLKLSKRIDELLEEIDYL